MTTTTTTTTATAAADMFLSAKPFSSSVPRVPQTPPARYGTAVPLTPPMSAPPSMVYGGVRPHRRSGDTRQVYGCRGTDDGDDDDDEFDLDLDEADVRRHDVDVAQDDDDDDDHNDNNDDRNARTLQQVVDSATTDATRVTRAVARDSLNEEGVVADQNGVDNDDNDDNDVDDDNVDNDDDDDAMSAATDDSIVDWLATESFESMSGDELRRSFEEHDIDYDTIIQDPDALRGFLQQVRSDLEKRGKKVLSVDLVERLDAVLAQRDAAKAADAAEAAEADTEIAGGGLVDCNVANDEEAAEARASAQASASAQADGDDVDDDEETTTTTSTMDDLVHNEFVELPDRGECADAEDTGAKEASGEASVEANNSTIEQEDDCSAAAESAVAHGNIATNASTGVAQSTRTRTQNASCVIVDDDDDDDDGVPAVVWPRKPVTMPSKCANIALDEEEEEEQREHEEHTEQSEQPSAHGEHTTAMAGDEHLVVEEAKASVDANNTDDAAVDDAAATEDNDDNSGTTDCTAKRSADTVQCDRCDDNDDDDNNVDCAVAPQSQARIAAVAVDVPQPTADAVTRSSKTTTTTTTTTTFAASPFEYALVGFPGYKSNVFAIEVPSVTPLPAAFVALVDEGYVIRIRSIDQFEKEEIRYARGKPVARQLVNITLKEDERKSMFLLVRPRGETKFRILTVRLAEKWCAKQASAACQQTGAGDGGERAMPGFEVSTLHFAHNLADLEAHLLFKPNVKTSKDGNTRIAWQHLWVSDSRELCVHVPNERDGAADDDDDAY